MKFYYCNKTYFIEGKIRTLDLSAIDWSGLFLLYLQHILLKLLQYKIQPYDDQYPLEVI